MPAGRVSRLAAGSHSTTESPPAAARLTRARRARLVENPPAARASRAERRQGTPSSCRSEEHTSELQSLMRISYAVFCLKKKQKDRKRQTTTVHLSHQKQL